MKKAQLFARILLGLIFVVFSADFVFGFMPKPPMEEAGAQFAGALFQTGYIFPTIKFFEFLGGLALLTGLFVPLALIFLAPIVLNIFLFNTFLAPSAFPLGLGVLALQLFLAWSYREHYIPLFKKK